MTTDENQNEAAEGRSDLEGVVMRRFRSNYSRHGCNWAIYNGDMMAADASGNAWLFRTRKAANEHWSNGNRPDQWIAG